jgi:hypothetical protein
MSNLNRFDRVVVDSDTGEILPGYPSARLCQEADKLVEGYLYAFPVDGDWYLCQPDSPMVADGIACRVWVECLD